MDNNRLDLLFQFLKEEPNDPFNIYAVATEYKNTFPEKALKYYEELLEKHPEYLPTYYHAAEVYIELNIKEKIEITYKKGIALAQQLNEPLPLRELQNAYNEYLFED
ncbi:MAG: tetratricopeptide repeat protein [Cyclobacteriaceae bacterium]|nr:tetratricopeptide repeat protein [Cyclobacteriaceae bacterium]